MDPLFEVKVLRQGDGEVLKVLGEVDMSTAPELREAIEEAADRGWPVVVDLSELAFMDSTGLTVLIQCERALSVRDVELTIVLAPDGPVRKVFEITNLLATLPVVDSLLTARSYTAKAT